VEPEASLENLSFLNVVLDPVRFDIEPSKRR
jgi:hypothetical protein